VGAGGSSGSMLWHPTSHSTAVVVTMMMLESPRWKFVEKADRHDDDPSC
jgi:hypothetical protein